jgi:ribosomal protein L31E
VASKKGEEWFFRNPVNALAKTSKIDDILSSLSNLKAKEFVSEEKKKGDVKKYGLDRPEYEITLGMPLENQEVTFSLHKEEDKLYATTSLSPKIVEAEDTLLTDLEKEAEELREKKVASFYSWEANRLHLKMGEIDWIVAKDEEDNWHFESPLKEEADRSKIQTFIRKIESLEAEEFIDPPLSLNLKEYGLDNPQAKVKIWIEENEDEENAKEITVLIGSEDKEAKKVVVKNARFDYLFRVDSAFLEEFPQDIKDWKPEEEEEEKEEKKEK